MTSQGLLVSVIIPVYNGARFLAAALESVFAQDYPSIETLVVDDGSTDGSAEIVRDFPDVRYYRRENGGVARARNFGISQAHGEILTFLDQDDLWTPNKLRVQLEYLARKSDAGYVLSHQTLRFEPGADAPRWLKRDLWHHEHPGFHLGTLAVRRAFFDRVGAFNPEFRYASDSEWLFRAQELGPRVFLPEALLIKRVHSENESRHDEAMKFEFYKSIRHSIQRRKGNSP